jgi:hypothetical protein
MRGGFRPWFSIAHSSQNRIARKVTDFIWLRLPWSRCGVVGGSMRHPAGPPLAGAFPGNEAMGRGGRGPSVQGEVDLRLGESRSPSHAARGQPESDRGPVGGLPRDPQRPGKAAWGKPRKGAKENLLPTGEFGSWTFEQTKPGNGESDEVSNAPTAASKWVPRGVARMNSTSTLHD